MNKPRFRTVLTLFLGAPTRPLFLYGNRMNKPYKPVGSYGFLTWGTFFFNYLRKVNGNSSSLAVYYNTWNHTGAQGDSIYWNKRVDVRQPGAEGSLLGKNPLRTYYGVERGGVKEAEYPTPPA